MLEGGRGRLGGGLSKIILFSPLLQGGCKKKLKRLKNEISPGIGPALK